MFSGEPAVRVEFLLLSLGWNADGFMFQAHRLAAAAAAAGGLLNSFHFSAGESLGQVTQAFIHAPPALRSQMRAFYRHEARALAARTANERHRGSALPFHNEIGCMSIAQSCNKVIVPCIHVSWLIFHELGYRGRYERGFFAQVLTMILYLYTIEITFLGSKQYIKQCI